MATTTALATEVVGFDPGRLARLDAYLDGFVANGRHKGSLLAITRGRRIAHVSHRGQRDAEAGLPVEPDTIWRIYSMTKPITSVAAMLLYKEGALSLFDPVAKFIPSFGTCASIATGWWQRPSPPALRTRCSSGTCSRTRPGSPTASSRPTP
jgi:CubicO group peptidase (beta-lactamase class C family)